MTHSKRVGAKGFCQKTFSRFIRSIFPPPKALVITVVKVAGVAVIIAAAAVVSVVVKVAAVLVAEAVRIVAEVVEVATAVIVVIVVEVPTAVVAEFPGCWYDLVLKSF